MAQLLILPFCSSHLSSASKPTFPTFLDAIPSPPLFPACHIAALLFLVYALCSLANDQQRATDQFTSRHYQTAYNHPHQMRFPRRSLRTSSSRARWKTCHGSLLSLSRASDSFLVSTNPLSVTSLGHHPLLRLLAYSHPHPSGLHHVSLLLPFSHLTLLRLPHSPSSITLSFLSPSFVVFSCSHLNFLLLFPPSLTPSLHSYNQ